MTVIHLKNALRSMVLEYGFEQVDESLREIRLSESHLEEPKENSTESKESAKKESRKRVPKTTAPQYVAKMELPEEKRQAVVELAHRFEGKTFLPSFGDITNFCQYYDIDKPASNSRASAIPRVFKFLASMEAADIKKVLNEGHFSGPSRLGPIADAIRRNGRAARV